jgi:hypothetical protein
MDYFFLAFNTSTPLVSSRRPRPSHTTQKALMIFSFKSRSASLPSSPPET